MNFLVVSDKSIIQNCIGIKGYLERELNGDEKRNREKGSEIERE